MVDTIMDFCPYPHETVLKLFKHIDLFCSLWSINLPTTPVSVIVEIILSRTGLKDSVAGYGPGKFVFEGAHFLDSFIMFGDLSGSYCIPNFETEQ